MEESDKLGARLADYCQKGRLCFLTGAGVDMERRSYVPSWDNLLSTLLKLIGREAREEDIKYVNEYRYQLLNEVILQKLDNVLSVETGRDEAGEVIRMCTDTNKYSPIHRFLAWAIQEFGNGVLTTNYNLLVEYAANDRVKQCGATPLDRDFLVKLHGSLDDIKNMRYKIDSVYAPLSDKLQQQAAPLLENHVLVVTGYSGADEFDVIPLIFEQHKPDDIVWIVHPSKAGGKDLDKLVVQRLSQDYGRETVEIDIDQLLAGVYRQIVSTGNNIDSELGQPWSRFNDVKNANWWLPGITKWADRLWSKHRDDMHFLWANIAEHVRASFADEAYKKSIAGADTMQRLYAEAHIAYLHRTRNKRDLNKFREAINEIQNNIYIETDHKRIKVLRQLLAWSFHQYGIACQNEQHYYEAKLMLEEALRERIATGDYEAPSSLFQLFMNGYEAHVRGHYPIDDFAPAGWRRWLDKELQRYQSFLRENNYAEQHSLIMHNRAMIHQAIAEEEAQEKQHDRASKEYKLALKLNSEAFNVRRRLRDPRMIAQSLTRICQCEFGIISINLLKGEKADIKRGEIQSQIDEIQIIYDAIPQEDNRMADLEKLKTDFQVFVENKAVLGW